MIILSKVMITQSLALKIGRIWSQLNKSLYILTKRDMAYNNIILDFIPVFRRSESLCFGYM